MAMSQFQQDMLVAFKDNSFGINGGVAINTSDATTGNFNTVHFVSSGSFEALTIASVTNSTKILEYTFSAGDCLYGNITSITLSTGNIIAYTAST